MDRRSSTDLMGEILNLDNAIVIDVGCGDGWLTRFLTKRGAHVTGVEVSPKALARARTIAPVGDEHYIQGLAEDLPAASRSTDIIIYYNSLHHVDGDGLMKALREAARVLRSGGILYVSEPMPEGPYFELMQPAHDETVARQRAQASLRYAPEYGLLLERALTHLDTVVFPNFQAFQDRLTSINPHIRDRFEEQEEEIQANFRRLAQKRDDRWAFDQPMRVTVLRRS
ncbi:MAG: class I SAM-dependent methyltransferase [Rhodospirillales bacterium]|nr:class I SAM-dependent methyltransferase [Rhodospirillales bacterium]